MNKNLLKTFLVAVGLAAGTSAWADTFEILYGVPQYGEDKETIMSVAPQTDFDGDENEQKDVVFSDANGTVCAEAMPIDGSVLYAGNGGGWTKYFATPVTSGKIIFSANYTVSANNSNTFRIVDSNGYVIYASSEQTTNGNANQKVATICGTEISYYVRQARKCAYGVKTLSIDLDARKVDYVLLVSTGANKVGEVSGTVNLPDEVKDVQGLSVQKTSYGAYLDNVCLYNQISEEKLYQYTLNYKFEGTTVSTSFASVSAGTEITANNIVYAENGDKYFLNDETNTFTVAATDDNTFEVNVRKAKTATLTVSTVIGGVSAETVTTLVEADDNTTNWSYYYPLYVEKDGKYYVCDNKEVFGQTGTFTDAQQINMTVSYSNEDGDVLFFGEAEDNTGATGDNLILDYNVSYSNGRAGARQAENYTNRGMAVGTYPAGSYEIITNIIGEEGRQIVVRDASSQDGTANEIAMINERGLQKARFVLTAESTELLVNGRTTDDNKANQSADFDYVIIKKVPADVPVSIAYSDGLATYTPAYDLDFTNAKNIAAYTATVSGDKVNLTRVNTVAAGEGVLIRSLNGGATEEEIPVAAETVEKTADNMFVGTLTDIDALATEGDGVVNYILNDGDLGTGFYRANNQKVGAGKAYLSVPAESAAKISFFSLDGTVTAIEGVEAEAAEGGKVFYNLSGQRVENPAKGLYIVNGKKVIIK